MSYSGAATAKTARENLGKALAALQEDPNIPQDVLNVAQNLAQAVGALFEAERASSEMDGKSSAKAAMGLVGQTLALLQDVRGQHRGIQVATESLAGSMSLLYPLTTAPSLRPSSPGNAPAPAPGSLAQPAVPQIQQPAAASVPAGYRDNRPREDIEVNIGATTESNFFVGFSGEIAEGGVFAATYNIFPRGTLIRVLVTLPGGFERHVNGFVRFVRDPMDMTNDETVPGMGVQFESLEADARELILRFVRKRPPMFYDE